MDGKDGKSESTISPSCPDKHLKTTKYEKFDLEDMKALRRSSKLLQDGQKLADVADGHASPEF
jgi:hypothetical protein